MIKLFEKVRHLRYLKKSVNIWLNEGAPIPTPHTYKQLTIIDYQKINSAKIFVESGTYRGDMIKGMYPFFNTIFSIEIDKKLYAEAIQRFVEYKNIYIFEGDSSSVLSDILLKIHDIAVFWLDGHFSGGITSKGKSNTPILKELELIGNHDKKDNHIILIDDIRCFDGSNDYPDLIYLKKNITELFPNHFYKNSHDIMRIIPNSLRGKNEKTFY